MVTYGYILYIIYGFTLLDMFFMVTYIYIYPLRLELHFQVG